MEITGITTGDPASIGPKITAEALSDPSVYERYKPLVVDDVPAMEKALKITDLSSKLKIHTVGDMSEAMFEYGTIDVCHMGMVDIDKLQRGKVSAVAKNAAFQYVKKTIGLVIDHRIDTTATNILNKEATNLADHHYSGHTEIYANYTGTRKCAMMLTHEDLRVVHVSTRVSLREACGRVKKDRILEVIRIAHQTCRRLGIFQPKIGVVGLNPHSGENGMLGREEIKEITPAIQVVRDEGIQADRPVPLDAVFSKARGSRYDIAVAMYHGQGYISLEVAGFVYNQEEQKWDAAVGMGITLNLPIIRASMDHGTAFDRVGTDLTSELSLTNAMDYAIRMAEAEEMEQIQYKRKGKNNGIHKVARIDTGQNDILE